MSLPDALLAALRDFAARIDALDPAAPLVGDLEVRLGGQQVRLTLRAPVARALVEALRAYHDPRDQGRCDHCGGRRLDDNFLCRDCGRPNGLFGQLLAERAARYTESEAIEAPPGGRHARDTA
ncbi:hypothetical protein [Planosporangium mesophilum]|uniref:Uncharacterized protein n=1 Tax=Planosporangium mesophilum TaxID=689768 RepID=A0A8J3TB67_9ACTN|nr:hypothetical protein [Planosporangium mesophilum]NJC84279.1 hypothetical protein [Planosporangium mesophilum]GII23124.1 hypothetical protein Pme01_27210 [Planosporangium mesophilum]